VNPRFENVAALEDVGPGEWTEKVYEPNSLGESGFLCRKPGYESR